MTWLTKVRQLQRDLGVVSFFRYHRGATFASSALMAPLSLDFVSAIEEGSTQVRIGTALFGPRR